MEVARTSQDRFSRWVSLHILIQIKEGCLTARRVRGRVRPSLPPTHHTPHPSAQAGRGSTASVRPCGGPTSNISFDGAATPAYSRLRSELASRPGTTLAHAQAPESIITAAEQDAASPLIRALRSLGTK